MKINVLQIYLPMKFPIVFVHGYLESADIWSEFIAKLPADLTIINHNLPGHGGRKPLNAENQMKAWVNDLAQTLTDSGYEKVIIVGHSMGGYVAASFACEYPEMIAGLCFFHSHPFADGEDKKLARAAGTQRILNGEIEDIIRAHAPKIYAPKNRVKYKYLIDRAIENALLMSDEAVIASNSAMASRTDCSEFVSQLTVPVLVIHGADDDFISTELISKIKLPLNGKLVVLNHSGHAGFNEEPETARQILLDFVQISKNHTV